jgi:type II secretory pathway component PulF
MSFMNVSSLFRRDPSASQVDSVAPFGKFYAPRWFIIMVFGLFHRRAFYRQLRVFSLATSPLADTLLNLSQQAREAGQAYLWYALNDIYLNMGEGTNFALALEDWCPPSEILLISSGSGGNKLLADAILRVLKRQKDMANIRTSFIFVMLEPGTVLVGTYFLMIWMATQFLSQLLSTTRGIDPSRFTGEAHQLVVLGEFGQGWHAIIPPAFAAGIVGLIVWSFPRWVGGVRRYFDLIPPWSIYRAVQGAGWMQSFAMLSESKVPYVKIMSDTAALAPPWLRERLLAARRLMITPGMPVGSALAATGYNFPSKSVALNLKAFGARPSFPDALSEVAEEWFTTIVDNMKLASSIVAIVTMLVATMSIIWLFQSANDLFSQVTTMLRSQYGG